MLRIVVEVWPGGDEGRRQVLDEVHVCNATGPGEVADYEVGWNDVAGMGVRKLTVRRHARALGRWRLLARVAADLADADKG